MVTTAVVGAGVVALGAGSALPQPETSTATLALDAVSAAAPDQETATAADSTRTVSTAARASRALRRAGVSNPKALPEWVVPALGPLSSLYGPRWGTNHRGIDIAAPYGARVRAAHAGKVRVAGWYGGYGKAVIIDHGEGVSTVYGHNSELTVRPGEWVETGQTIARVGSTGFSTGPHLHFEVRYGDQQVNPIPFLVQRGVSLGPRNTGL
ncbi:MAG TPA: M23 family metallopeptidase [Cryptosporangiaceae bacterium]|nr:M23 family metallopeptidase [Cryptosporangiaceae bacterium]